MQYNIGMVSLGCSKNLVDTEIMLGLLDKEGFKIVNDQSLADIIIINTCGFIDSAKQESIDNILEMAQLKENARCKLLIVTGCLAERYKDEIIKEIPEVDAVIGTGNYHEIAEVIQKSFKGSKITRYGNQNFTPEEGLPRIQSTPFYTAYLKIADGCDNFCTYCIIPKLRGKYRSRTIESIVDEAKALANKGVNELIIIAQDTTRYGIDLNGEHRLSHLLDELCKIDKIKWIRLHYCYPEDITDELIKTIALQKKICKYLDIPIQHSNDQVLKRMGRRGNRRMLTDLIKKIRDQVPEVTLRTSLIVGFPGETEEQFDDLVRFVSEAQFERMGVFTYSQEEGTPAADFEEQISEDIKKQRFERIMEIQSNISKHLNDLKLQKVFEVLVEGYDQNSKVYYGRTYADSIDIDGRIYFTSAREIKTGEYVRVRVLKAVKYDLIGEISHESGQ